MQIQTIFLDERTGFLMKIEELIAGKNEGQDVQVAGASLPISALKRFMDDGYTHLKPYQAEKTFSFWGKTRTGCFSEQEIIKRP